MAPVPLPPEDADRESQTIACPYCGTLVLAAPRWCERCLLNLPGRNGQLHPQETLLPDREKRIATAADQHRMLEVLVQQAQQDARRRYRPNPIVSFFRRRFQARLIIAAVVLLLFVLKECADSL